MTDVMGAGPRRAQEPHVDASSTTPVWIESLGKRASGAVEVRAWSGRSRLVRGAKVLGACWALALVSLLVPAAHFVLVPVFLLAGPIGALIVGGQRSTVLGGEGACPECGERVRVGASAEEWPLHDACARCRTPLRIERQ